MSSSPRRLRMILNTFYSGPQAWFFLADDRGYLRQEGIELEFVEGDTAANAVPKVASGDFDVGYGDTNALVELAGAGEAPSPVVAVFATFNDSPYTIAVPSASAVREPRDLAGRTLGAHPRDAAMLMFPEFAASAGIDAASVAVDICADPHRDMVARMVRDRAWDGMFGFVNTLRAASIEAGLDSQEMRFLEYRHVVPDLYGSAVMVTRSLAGREPALVAGLVRAINRGLVDTIADVDAGIDAVAKRNPAFDRKANRERLAGTLALEMANPEGARLGIGDVDDARLARAVDLIARSKRLRRRPPPDEIFSRRFLPPLSSRVCSLARTS